MKDFPWDHSRRFNAYSNYIKKKFGGRIQKVSLNAGFTCPNRDGKLSSDGCIYCNNKGFSPSYCNPEKSIYYQLDEGIKFLSKRYSPKKYVAYFQAYTNTYGSITDIEKLYLEALSHPLIEGLVIGTRPDCIDIDKVKLLEQLAKDYYIDLEFGIESCYDETLEYINRGHTFKQTLETLEMCSGKDINMGGHFIFGLPTENEDMMLAQAKIISDMPLTSVKFHQLQILKDTPVAKLYESNPESFNLFSYDDYLDFVIKFTEKLNPKIVIERFVSESPPYVRIAPDWGMKRMDVILNEIERRMQLQDTWQGKYF